MDIHRIVKLTPPRLSVEHIKEKIICIRAHRERIFRVAVEYHAHKLLFHNYGQGGAGWTFLFGCVHESMRQFDEQLAQNRALTNKSIAVIGAGCYGLLTAILLARKGHAVRVIAQEADNISSYKAAGFFFPRPRKMSTMQERAIFESFGMESYVTYQQIIQGLHPFIKAGPKLLPGYFGLDIDPGFAPYMQQGVMAAPEKVVVDFGNGKSYEAMEYKTIFIDAAAIMQELKRNMTTLAIPIINAEVQAFDDISESIVFNCAGLGAKELVADKRVIPVQGHLITLKNQPPMHQLQYMINAKVVMHNALGVPRDELIYYAPKESGILGITFIRGQSSLTANQHEFDRLWQRCLDYFGAT